MRPLSFSIVNHPPTTILTSRIDYVEFNPEAETTIIMAHGWPSLWSTWSKQIEEFKVCNPRLSPHPGPYPLAPRFSPRITHAALSALDDYHLLVPDLRGFGSSTHPDDVQSSGTMYDIAGDLVCILQHAGVREAICLGHDWGAQVCYEAARIRPDVFKAVIGLVIPVCHFPFIPHYLAHPPSR